MGFAQHRKGPDHRNHRRNPGIRRGKFIAQGYEVIEHE